MVYIAEKTRNASGMCSSEARIGDEALRHGVTLSHLRYHLLCLTSPALQLVISMTRGISMLTGTTIPMNVL